MTLHYEFPINITLSEVREVIKDDHNFIIVEKDSYTVVNYVRMGSDTFPPVIDRASAIRRELRGLIFDTETGKVISRPYAKFFNYGERADVTDFNITESHHFLEKLDGSMIRPIPIRGHIRWGTKMGVTEVSMQAEVFVANNPQYQKAAEYMIGIGMTPIFEWCSRQQRIVVDYPEDQLILTAVRSNFNGRYLSYTAISSFASFFDIPVVSCVESHDASKTFEENIESVRKWEDREGIVIRFDDGHMVKVKADTYISLHRAKSMLENERDVVGLIIDEKTDDLMPLLSDDDKKKLVDFQDAVWKDIYDFWGNINNELMLISASGIFRKDFAIKTQDSEPTMRGLIFKVWDKKEEGISLDMVKQNVYNHLSSNAQFEKTRGILKTARWNPVVID
jgi:RNA ligase